MRLPRLFALLSISGVVACGTQAPPKPVAAAPSASVSVAPPPPPPKCEALEEKCLGASGKRVRVVLARLTIEPPAGWTYALEADQTVAMAGDARLAVTVYDGVGDEKKDAKARDAALNQLYTRLSVKPPKKSMPWRDKPAQTSVAGKLSIAMWQLNGASVDKNGGPVLVAHAKLATGGGIVAIGFVPDDDKANADVAILTALESLRDEASSMPGKPAASGARAP
jgi:hypothetical protein